MSKAKILYVSQEIQPFCPETIISRISRQLPQGAHEKDKEIRVFMPRYGKINERRHQLHEVIRLSGMNLIVNDTDHPLIIKVASIPSARMQVYFIDNEEYFKRKHYLTDEDGDLFEDSDERAMFFSRGVLETVKKLGWVPDVIHCHGWMSSLMPVYAKHMYKNDAHFADSKVVYSVYDNGFEGQLSSDFTKKLQFDGVPDDIIPFIDKPTFENLNKAAIKYSDGVLVNSDVNNAKLSKFIDEQNIPVVNNAAEDSIVADAISLYDTVLEGNHELVED